jgi:hypothetical protein
MNLNDTQLGVFVSKVLHLGPDKRKEFIAQVDHLIKRLTAKIEEDDSFEITGFKKTGSLVKGTVLKPKGDFGVDADIAAFLDISESEKEDVDRLHAIIKKLLVAVYPTKKDDDFKIQPRTLGIHFHESGLDVDLVPVIPIKGNEEYGWQPSSEGGKPIKTSIKKQLDFIKKRRDADPRFKSLVRLLKKWRNEHELESFRSFSIELIVVYLNDRDGASNALEEGLQRFFLFVAQTGLKEKISFAEHGKIMAFPNDPVVILDPVNKENNVALRLTEGERKEIVTAAQTAWETIEAARWKGTKGETIDLWKEVMGRSFVIEND